MFGGTQQRVLGWVFGQPQRSFYGNEWIGLIGTVSANEARFARDYADRFHPYRLFEFRATPRMFELAGPIEQHCMLDPLSCRASFG